MGGMGSTRWQTHVKADTVEDCRTVDVSRMGRERWLVPGMYGTLRWLRGEAVVASIGYRVEAPSGVPRFLVLSYRSTRGAGPCQEVTLRVPLESVPMRFGGVRWYAHCPLYRSGVYCGRRVTRLHLPPGSHLFGCRHCHQLTYTSAQEHDGRLDILRRSPEALEDLLANIDRASPRQLFAALKLLRPDRYR